MTRDAAKIASARAICASSSLRSGKTRFAHCVPGHAIMFQLTSKRVILSRTDDEAFETALLACPTSSGFCSANSIGSSPTTAKRAVLLSNAFAIPSNNQSVTFSKEALSACLYRAKTTSGSV